MYAEAVKGDNRAVPHAVNKDAKSVQGGSKGAHGPAPGGQNKTSTRRIAIGQALSMLCLLVVTCPPGQPARANDSSEMAVAWRHAVACDFGSESDSESN